MLLIVEDPDCRLAIGCQALQFASPRDRDRRAARPGNVGRGRLGGGGGGAAGRIWRGFAHKDDGGECDRLQLAVHQWLTESQRARAVQGASTRARGHVVRSTMTRGSPPSTVRFTYTSCVLTGARSRSWQWPGRQKQTGKCLAC